MEPAVNPPPLAARSCSSCPLVQPDPPTFSVSVAPLLTLSVEVLLPGNAAGLVAASVPPLIVVEPV